MSSPRSSAFKSLPAAEQHALMTRIVARCKSAPGEPSSVVVFDLDGTLMDNRPRTLVILQELAQELRAEAHSSAETLFAAKAESLAYLLGDSLRLLGLEHPELVSRAESFWRERFFSDHYLRHDVALAGAVDFARACYEAGAVLVYFTGRDLPLMGLGSFQSLRDLGFPIGVVGTELVCKPDAAIPDEEFKRKEGPLLRRVGRVVAAFDNEPGNCNAFLEMSPEADVVFVDTQHLPGAPPLDDRVQIVRDFRMR
ncbi:MAG: HAD family hydrolase [Labilithrix sp.]|nr:HAD family hydrolase [Labilithrix sp.]